MPETQLNVGAKLARNLITYFIASFATFVGALFGSIFFPFIVCLAAAAACGVFFPLVFMLDREKRAITSTGNIALLGFGLLGTSLEFESLLGSDARIMAYSSICILIFGILTAVYFIFLPVLKISR